MLYRIAVVLGSLVFATFSADAADAPYKQNENAKPLGKEGMEWFFGHYLESEQDGKNPRVSILDAKNLSGLPPATIITAEIDPLRSEGQQLANKLKKAGVKVDYRNYPGVTHEFFGMGAVLPDAKQAVKQAAAGLRGSFQPAAAGGSGK